MMLHVVRTTQNGRFYNFYTSVMLHVMRITLDDAEWMILQFFYTSVMLHVARITLDESEWMILQFFFYTSVDDAEWTILQFLH